MTLGKKTIKSVGVFVRAKKRAAVFVCIFDINPNGFLAAENRMEHYY